MTINWNCPSPRPGFQGWLDRLTGPEATTSELLVQFIPSVIVALAAPIYVHNLSVDWTPLQLGLISLFGFDLVGGVLTNATSSAKRWFHRPEQTWQHHLGFVSIHIIHILLVAIFFRGLDWNFFLIVRSLSSWRPARNQKLFPIPQNFYILLFCQSFWVVALSRLRLSRLWVFDILLLFPVAIA